MEFQQVLVFHLQKAKKQFSGQFQDDQILHKNRHHKLLTNSRLKKVNLDFLFIYIISYLNKQIHAKNNVNKEKESNSHIDADPQAMLGNQ